MEAINDNQLTNVTLNNNEEQKLNSQFNSEYKNKVLLYSQQVLQTPSPARLVDITEIKEKKKKKPNKCYTCHPRGSVKKHIICETNGFVFHFDLKSRPMIIVTPKEHVVNINDMDSEKMCLMFKTIDAFMKFRNLNDYQILFNVGDWKNHEHFHIKIKAQEELITQIRTDHFKTLDLQKNYNHLDSHSIHMNFAV